MPFLGGNGTNTNSFGFEIPLYYSDKHNSLSPLEVLVLVSRRLFKGPGQDFDHTMAEMRKASSCCFQTRLGLDTLSSRCLDYNITTCTALMRRTSDKTTSKCYKLGGGDQHEEQISCKHLGRFAARVRRTSQWEETPISRSAPIHATPCLHLLAVSRSAMTSFCWRREPTG